MEKKIKCSVGILTFNSGEFFERCLKSLDGFAEIVVADGGSTDNTLAIAKKYGCKIIQQSRQGEPINDFAVERNRLLDASAHDWFFYLDSDEIISPELKEEIMVVCSEEKNNFYVYKISYRIISRDLFVKYKSFKKYYQERFFNKKSGARFGRKMHEKIFYDKEKNQAGVLTGEWFVPLDVQLDFGVYKSKVDHRLKIMAEEKYPFGFKDFFRYAVHGPFKNVAKLMIKFVYMRLKYDKKELIPARYEFYKLYSQWVIFREFTKQYFGHKG